MKRTILAMTVLAAFACTAQTSSSTPSSSPSQSPTTQSTSPSTTTPDMQQTPQSTNPSTTTPDMQQTPQTTTPPSNPDMQSNPNANPNQTPSTTMPQSDQPGAASSAGQTSSMSTSSTGQAYEGCLKEKKGEYWLMSADGTKYHVSSTSDLSAHKNHEVRVTGDTASAASNMSGSNATNAQSLNATNVEDVSSSCKMGNKGNTSPNANPSSSNPSTYPK